MRFARGLWWLQFTMQYGCLQACARCRVTTGRRWAWRPGERIRWAQQRCFGTFDFLLLDPFTLFYFTIIHILLILLLSIGTSFGQPHSSSRDSRIHPPFSVTGSITSKIGCREDIYPFNPSVTTVICRASCHNACCYPLSGDDGAAGPSRQRRPVSHVSSERMLQDLVFLCSPTRRS